MAVIFSQVIRDKLAAKHSVSEDDVRECFANKAGQYLEDPRADHQTDPPTLWFVSETNSGRRLKVIFVYRDGNIFIKSAYGADENSIRIYERLGK
ncbi:MAG: hypothetical protein K9J42_13390 [Sulfuritalea sp.]|nr:hypothetical protein [Sulfuritalea sp.]